MLWTPPLSKEIDLTDPPHRRTGEEFVMQALPYNDPTYRQWTKLVSTIEHLGAEVHMASHGAGDLSMRHPMYVRDTGVYVPTDRMGRFVRFDGTHAHSSPIPQESEALVREDAFNGVRQDLLQGLIEGGNLIYDPSRKVLFVGVAHAEALTEQINHMLKGNPPMTEAESRKHIVETAASVRLGLQSLKSWGMTHHIKVVPLFIENEHARRFFHLDGALGLLPSGQAIVCRDVLGERSAEILKRTLGEKNMHFVSKNEAEQGATNFITVGDHVVTPYANKRTQQKFVQWGYKVVDPASVGLYEGDWLFGPMGSIRCATLKVTPDQGFPQAKKAQREVV